MIQDHQRTQNHHLFFDGVTLHRAYKHTNQHMFLSVLYILI